MTDQRLIDAKTLSLNDVVLSPNGTKVYRIGSYYYEKKPEQRKRMKFNVEFLRVFCAKNCIVKQGSKYYGSMPKEELLDIIVKAKVESMVTPDLNQSVLIEDDEEIDDFLVNGMAKLSLEEEDKKERLQLEQQRLQYKKIELIIQLHEQIRKIQDDLLSLNVIEGDDTLVEELKKDAFTMLRYFHKLRSELIVE